MFWIVLLVILAAGLLAQLAHMIYLVRAVVMRRRKLNALKAEAVFELKRKRRGGGA